MTSDNLIFIKGGTYANLKKILREWMETYSDDLPDDLTFELYKNGRRKYMIKVRQTLDNWAFYFLVKSLDYYGSIEYTVEVEGFTSGNDDNIFRNEKLLVYISPDDEEGDNVNITTSENKYYKIDFNWEITKVSEAKPYYPPNCQCLESPEIIKINKDEISRKREQEARKQEQKSKENANKRFKIISFLTVTLFLINLILLNYTNDVAIFEKTIGFLCAGVSLWFLVDDGIFRSGSLFLRCLLIAFGIFCYGYIVGDHFQTLDITWLLVSSSFPMIILVIKWPVWKAFY